MSQSPGEGSVAVEGSRAQLPSACGSCTGTGAQADGGKQNLGRGKEARSLVDISAKSVPGLMFVNFLLFVCASHLK